MVQRRIVVKGTVQGVGFRPFVYRLAVQNDLRGSVKNRGDAGVEIIVQGDESQIRCFLQDLQVKAPPSAQIVSLDVASLRLDGRLTEFVIQQSETGGEGSGTIPPDIAICNDCGKDIKHQCRYHNYWATSCTNCGPRFTVIKELPYDRERTSMLDFPMCAACRSEYTNPSDRRYHAQTIACPQCGPQLEFNGYTQPDAIAQAIQALKVGRILAMKGVGGTHLACDATREPVVSKLRARRHRFFQPFAIMATEPMLPTLTKASAEELALLRSWRRPIVLLERREGAPLAPAIAPGLHNVGVMLPYSGLHHLLFEQIDFPIVMTSANMPGEPMLVENQAIEQKLKDVADDFLLHDRDIISRCDDSVVRRSGGSCKFIRRSRGWAPSPIDIKLNGEPTLALGAELQNTIALYAAGKCYISQHIGDVDDVETFEFLKEAMEHLLKITGQKMPKRIVCDLHPQFLTTRLAHELSDSAIQVQHHHAHVASVMGERGLEEAIGIAVDGIGYGSDGRIWGGEVLSVSRTGITKLGGLSDVLMPGGDRATRYPARMVAGILFAGGLRGKELRAVLAKHVCFPRGLQELAVVLKQLESKTSTFETSSAGRFLDAVSALLGLCEERTYEGEPAMRLESAAMRGKPVKLELRFIVEHGHKLLDVPDLFSKLLQLKERKHLAADIAATAQDALACGLAEIALAAAREHEIKAICLSGGVAYNDQITCTIKRSVERAGYEFYSNERVPCGDGGISFGQVVVAGACARATRRSIRTTKKGGPLMSQRTRVESLLSARLFLSPQLVGDRIFFISNLAGKLSLYAMDKAGSVPEPLLPPDIALQNPTLMGGESFVVLPKLKKILVMIDRDGDENYQPCLIPIDGGIPEPAFGDRFAGQQVHCSKCDVERNLAFFQVDPRTSPQLSTYQVDLKKLQLTELGTSLYGNWFGGANSDYSKILLIDSYTSGDHVLYLWKKGDKERSLLYGKPIEARTKGEQVPLNSIHACHFTPKDRGIVFVTSLFEDGYGLGYLALSKPDKVEPVRVTGLKHRGAGELNDLEHLTGQRYVITYNIDGCSYAYEGAFDEKRLRFTVEKTLCGGGGLRQGVLQSRHYDKKTGDYAFAFSTATSPAQIYTISRKKKKLLQHTRERLLGVAPSLLSAGEDASYLSHDGMRVSARLYLPAKKLGFQGRRPLIFYVHGGPQSQERPDFTWFSMPLIQLLTMNGFAVFVPNVRGSSGYGLQYMKQVDRDWGGQDRLDHVHAMNILAKDERLDTQRAGVVGRSYGGFMTLTLVGRHPELWRAGCDMFGPYNMLTFLDRIPEAWKTYFHLSVGHPERDKAMLIDRSPKTHLHQLACPLLVIQGKNDPRVREIESRDVVEELRAQGKQVEYLVFENEGHDVLKYENRVRCYSEIVRFFSKHLC